MSRSMTFAVAAFAGTVCGLIVPLYAQRTNTRPLTFAEMQIAMGGACPHIKCNDEKCRGNAGCLPYTLRHFLCEPVVGTTKCLKIFQNDYARCEEAAGSNRTCSETSDAGCITQKTGDQLANGSCPAAACSQDSGTCADTRYICTDTGCE